MCPSNPFSTEPWWNLILLHFSLAPIVPFSFTQAEMLLLGMWHHKHFLGLLKSRKLSFPVELCLSTLPPLLTLEQCHWWWVASNAIALHFWTRWVHTTLPVDNLPFNALSTQQSLTVQEGVASVSLHCYPKARQSFSLRAQAGQLMGELRMRWNLQPESSASCLHNLRGRPDLFSWQTVMLEEGKSSWVS
jgi:hypothetical protein